MYFRKGQILTYSTINISLNYNYYIIHLPYTSVKLIYKLYKILICNKYLTNYIQCNSIDN